MFGLVLIRRICQKWHIKCQHCKLSKYWLKDGWNWKIAKAIGKKVYLPETWISTHLTPLILIHSQAPITISFINHRTRISDYRQYKEQLRQQRQTSTSVYQSTTSVRNGHVSTTANNTETMHQSYSDSRISTSKEIKKLVVGSSRIQSDVIATNGKNSSTSLSKTTANIQPPSPQQQFDVKTMQKEAVLSYVKVCCQN